MLIFGSPGNRIFFCLTLTPSNERSAWLYEIFYHPLRHFSPSFDRLRRASAGFGGQARERQRVGSGKISEGGRARAEGRAGGEKIIFLRGCKSSCTTPPCKL
jgi:hypothetical protein